MPEAPVMASALNALQSEVAKPKLVLSDASMNSDTGDAGGEDRILSEKSLAELTKQAHEVLDGKKVLFMGDSCTRQDMGVLMCLIDGSKGLKEEDGAKSGCDVEYFLRNPPPGMELGQQPNAINVTSKINTPGGARDHFWAKFSKTNSLFEFMWLPDLGRVQKLLSTNGPYDCDNTGNDQDKMHHCHLNDVAEQLRTPGKWDIIFIAVQGGANKNAPKPSNLKKVMQMMKSEITSGPVIARSNHAEDFETHKGMLWGWPDKNNNDMEIWVEQEKETAQEVGLPIVDLSHPPSTPT